MSREMHSLFSKLLIYVPLVVVVVFSILTVYWLYSVPNNALSFHTPITVTTKNTKPGSFVVIDTGYFCKNIKETGKVSTSLVGQTTQLMLPSGREAFPKGCSSTLNFALPIPAQATPGLYHFHFKATYQVNPIRTIVQEYDTQDFVVE